MIIIIFVKYLIYALVFYLIYKVYLYQIGLKVTYEWHTEIFII